MGALGDLLFYRRDQVGLDDVLRYKVDELRNKVDALPEAVFSQLSDEAIAKQVAEREAVSSLSIDLDAGRPSVRECQLEVEDQFRRGLVRVPGLEVTKEFPFKGDPELWRLRTNPWNMNPPRGEIRGNVLVVGIRVRANEGDAAADYIKQVEASIPEYLARQEHQIAQYNASLAASAMRWIVSRRQRLGAASDLLNKLNGKHN